LEIWLKELSDGKAAIAFFNRGNSAMDFDPGLKVVSAFQGKHFWDLCSRKQLVLDATTSLHVPSHGVLLLEQR
jgi:alpha-galactosidase